LTRAPKLFLRAWLQQIRSWRHWIWRGKMERSPGTLTWSRTGPWAYALGDFGSICGFSGLPPWLARVRGRILGHYRNLDAARTALERSARAAHYGISLDGPELGARATGALEPPAQLAGRAAWQRLHARR
jgi:hypothetical protein